MFSRIASQNTFSSEGTYENFSRLTRPVEIADKLTESQRPDVMKLIPKFDFQAKWIPESGSGGMEMLRFGIGTKLGLPGPELTNFGLKRSFFILNPNFDYTSVDWKPDTEFPDSLYTAGLNISWIQPFNDRWMLMVGASPSWASDGKETKDSIRCQGMFGFTWTPNKEWKVVFGGAYPDRDDINFMPFGGAIWPPNEDWRLELMAPQARLAMRLREMSDRNYDRWVYTGVGVEGGNWAVRSVDDRADFKVQMCFLDTVASKWILSSTKDTAHRGSTYLPLGC